MCANDDDDYDDVANDFQSLDCLARKAGGEQTLA